ncbi:hypothetical protein ASE70_08075 [Sphingomonas sp. Leaf22]|uniref:hypothetical protein n=1 Tax=Sphingomonas sp. Leaf22 TaxID=1735687 RepID=UPI0007011248|nr:hypothetical protein [Sphingomonas sp. Leaf22]KQM76719.1 hypothetical protein ASE70_08075 [Sphingomonas sp. Leaf22]
MGTKKFNSIWDLVRHGANLQVWCACGHIAVIDRHQLDHMKRTRNWPAPIGYLCGKLRCAKCGRRPTKVSPSANDPTVRIGPSLADVIATQAQDEP